MDERLESAEFRQALGELRQTLPRAHAAMEDVRRRLELCWPTRPSLRVLDSESHDLCKEALRLVVAGGIGDWGTMPLAIEGGKDTLDAFGRPRPEDLPVDSWDWALALVDRVGGIAAAQPLPPALDAQLARAVERSLEHLRVQERAPGTLGERLRSLLDHRST